MPATHYDVETHLTAFLGFAQGDLGLVGDPIKYIDITVQARFADTTEITTATYYVAYDPNLRQAFHVEHNKTKHTDQQTTTTAITNSSAPPAETLRQQHDQAHALLEYVVWCIFRELMTDTDYHRVLLTFLIQQILDCLPDWMKKKHQISDLPYIRPQVINSYIVDMADRGWLDLSRSATDIDPNNNAVLYVHVRPQFFEVDLAAEWEKVLKVRQSWNKSW